MSGKKKGAKKGEMSHREWEERNWIDQLEGYSDIEKNYMKAYVNISKTGDFMSGYQYLGISPEYEEISAARKEELKSVCRKKEYECLESNYWSFSRKLLEERPGY